MEDKAPFSVPLKMTRIIGIFGLSLIGIFGARADVIRANSAGHADVQSAVNMSHNGDVVVIPAGVAVWGSTLTINDEIFLVGAGIGNTIIINNAGRLIYWACQSNGFARLSGIEIEHGSEKADACVYVTGTCHAFRMDNCQIDNQNEYSLWFDNWIYGCVDHCTFNIVGTAVEIEMQGYGGQRYGDGSWADADNMGTTNAIYFENDSFTGPIGAHIGMLDGYYGSRAVVRYCNSTNCPIGSHGTDNGGRGRGVREYEVYMNNMIYQTNNGSVWGQMEYMRSGTSVVWSNNIIGGYLFEIVMANYRYTPVNWPPFMCVSGSNVWDSNNITLFDSGTATGPDNSATLIDNTKNWTVSQFVDLQRPFVVYDVRQGIAAGIHSNTANTIMFNGSFEGYRPGSMTINHGDEYQIRQVYATLDQPGYGHGDLLANAMPINSVTSVRGWPNEKLDPMYEWGNNFVVQVGGFPSGIIGGLGTNTYQLAMVRPGYTPLVYPHPLTTNTWDFTNSLNVPMEKVENKIENNTVVQSQPPSSGCNNELATIGSGPMRSDSFWAGYLFVCVTNITVCTLERMAMGPPSSKTHTVVLLSPNGVVATATVNMSGVRAGDYAQASISPVILEANQTYCVMSDETVGDEWFDSVPIVLTGAAAKPQQVYSLGEPASVANVNRGSGNETYGGANLKY
jgi:hypothetical protein